MGISGQAGTGPGSDPIGGIMATVRQHGGRATPARRFLAEALIRAPGHQTADELTADVQAVAPDVNRSTIYRNLEELVRLQVVDRTCYQQGAATYHLASRSHSHLVCERCGQVTEIPDALFSDLGSAALDQYGFTIEPRKSAIIGQCQHCAGTPSPGNEAGRVRAGARRT